jgi:ABC-type phosphate transport system permease subunit
MAIYDARRRRSKFYLGLCYACVIIGLGWLAIILGTLLFQGFRGLTPAVFTQMTPPPGASGGLLNAIIGSLIMTTLGVAIGTPLGMLAGTYMAEYGRYSKLTIIVRFINDILLSAPSIVIGLFIYEVMVVNMGHFSALAGLCRLPSSSFRLSCARPRICCFWCLTSCGKPRGRLAFLAPLSSVRSPIAPPARVLSPEYFSPSRASAARRRPCSSPR